MLRRLGVNGAVFLAALFVIGCSKAGAPTTRQSEVTRENKATGLSRAASEGSPPHARIYRLYEAGKLVEARLALLRFVRQNAEASTVIGSSRQFDLETKLSMGLVVHVVSHCIKLEHKHGEPHAFPQELREAARTAREALDVVVGQVRSLCHDKERLVVKLAYAEDQKAGLLTREIAALQAAGETEQATALARQYAGFWRSRGIALDGRGVPLVCRPAKASFSTAKGSHVAVHSAGGEPRRAGARRPDRGPSSVTDDVDSRTKPGQRHRTRSGLAETETSFWTTLADGDPEAFRRFYAERITLKAGSELLKPRWGIASDRGKDTMLARNKLMAGYGRMIGEFGRDKWRKAFSKIGEDRLAVTVVAEPDQPFPGTRKGDRLLTVETGVGDDRLFYVFRRQGTEWRIVIEVTDY